MFVSCSGKRQALGADNEIRVICSEIDQEIIEKYLSKIFTDTIFTPEPEPYYHLKFSSPETFLSLKSQSQVIVAAIHQDKSNPGYQLMSRLLSSKQISNTLENDPIILGQDVYAKNQVLVIINAKSEELLMQSVENKKVLIKGCAQAPIPTWAYMIITTKLIKYAKNIYFGESCSAIKIY